MIIKIKKLRLRTIVGTNDWEREKLQDVIINVKVEFDGSKAADTDSIDDTVNYKMIKTRIIETVEKSRFHLLEKLVSHILHVIMEDDRVQRAEVEVDKPHALRFAESVSVSCSAVKK